MFKNILTTIDPLIKHELSEQDTEFLKQMREGEKEKMIDDKLTKEFGDHDEDKEEKSFFSQVLGMNDTLPDSGARREFDTGSVRDVREGKGRYDLLSPFVTKADAKLMEKGAVKYDARNWEKGQPVMSFFDSCKRHLEKYVECLLLGEEEAEDHLAAARWNLGGIIHVLEMIRRGHLPIDLDDRPGPQPRLLGRTYNDQRNVPRGVDNG